MIGTDIGTYRVIARIAQGGMSEVFKAIDRRTGYSMALKVVHRRARPEERARVMLEARAASALRHRRIYQVVDVGETRLGELYLVMPYYPGEILQRKLVRGALPLKRALDIAVQVADGLGEAHRHGIVHRDIKPSNILVSPNGAVTILDFGLARLPESSFPAEEGGILGTTAYAAPEQLRGEGVDGRSDLWSLGIVLYEMSTATLPFRGAPGPEMREAILTKEPAPLELEPGPIHDRLQEVIFRALRKAPGERPASAEAFIDELRVVQGIERRKSGRTAPPPPPGGDARGADAARSNRLWGRVRRRVDRLRSGKV